MPSVDLETKAMQDEIYRSKVLRAREMSIGERMALGPKLFDEGMSLMRSSIRSDHPDFNDQQIEAEVTRRLKIRRALNERGIYRDAGVLDE